MPSVINPSKFRRLYKDQVSDYIRAIAWSDSGDTLAAISASGEVVLWRPQEHKRWQRLDLKPDSETNGGRSLDCLGLSAKGQYLAVSGHEGVKIWDLGLNPSDLNTQEPKRLDVPGASLGASWSHCGQYLASGNLDRTLSVLDWENPPPWLMQGFPGKVSLVAWPDSSPPDHPPHLAAACMDGITIWQRESATGGSWHSTVLTEHDGFIRAIAFQPNSTLLASAGDDSKVILWKEAQTIHQTLQGPKSGTACLAWHPKGNHLALGGIDGTLMVYGPDESGQGFAQ